MHTLRQRFAPVWLAAGPAVAPLPNLRVERTEDGDLSVLKG